MGGYQFLMSAIDGEIKEKGDSDLFRIKIWDELTEEIVYDNQIEEDIDADPTTALVKGSIIIYAPKLKNASLSNTLGGIEENIKSISVYPNPTSGIVEIIGLDKSSLYTLKLFDVKGTELYRLKDIKSGATIDLSNLPSGIYNLSLINKKVTDNFKVVKK